MQKWLVALCAVAAAQSAQAGDLHVPGQFSTIQDAIFFADHGDTVIVADGVFTGAGNRDINLLGKNITVRSANGAANCVIDCAGTSQEPYRAFLIENGETRDAVIQGFTIMRGATLPGAIADEFNGGGIRIVLSSPTIRECKFIDNFCGCWGAAVYAGHGGNPLIERCEFVDNYSDDDGGAVFSWNGTHIEIRDSLMLNNSARVSGGAIASFDPMTLTNVTVLGNDAPSVGGVYAFPLTIDNSIFWGNSNTQVNGTSQTTVTYSIVQGGFAGLGNLDLEPLFAADGYHLLMGSPGVNQGDPAFVPQPGQGDIDGEARVINDRVDMGADELRPAFQRAR